MRHPLRERFRYQLMLALYRSDRQADALEAYQAARRELSDGLGLEPSESLKQLEAAILRQEPELAPPTVAGGRLRAARPEPGAARCWSPRAHSTPSMACSRIARPLAAGDPARELIVAGVVEPDEVGDATARLAGVREQLIAEGVATRTAAFSSPAPGDDVARLASQEAVDLLLLDAGEDALEARVTAVLERAPCDVALLVRGSAGARAGSRWWCRSAPAPTTGRPSSSGTWFARATGGPLRLVGRGGPAAPGARREPAARRRVPDRPAHRRDRRRARPHATRAGGCGGGRRRRSPAGGGPVRALARGRARAHPRASSRRQPPAPTVFVRRGARPGGLRRAETRTRFSWSMAGTAA